MEPVETQYPWASHHMTPERRNIAVDLAFAGHQTLSYIALMQYRVTGWRKVEVLPRAMNEDHTRVAM